MNQILTESEIVMIQENPPVHAPSERVERVLTILEETGVPTVVNDAIVELIENWEYNSSLPYFGQIEHPEGHEGDCGCDLCLFYAAE